MDWGTAVFFGVVIVIAANQLVMRIAALRRSPWFFWGVQILNIAVGSTVIVFGLPGFTDFWFVQYILGLLIFFHVIQNNMARVSFLRREREERIEALRREQRARLAAAPEQQRDQPDDEGPPGERAG